MAMQANEPEARLRADGGDQARRILEHHTEFLVFMRRRQKLVSVRVHAAVDAESH